MLTEAFQQDDWDGIKLKMFNWVQLENSVEVESTRHEVDFEGEEFLINDLQNN